MAAQEQATTRWKYVIETIEHRTAWCKMPAGMAYMDQDNQVAGIVNICAKRGWRGVVTDTKW